MSSWNCHWNETHVDWLKSFKWRLSIGRKSFDACMNGRNTRLCPRWDFHVLSIALGVTTSERDRGIQWWRFHLWSQVWFRKWVWRWQEERASIVKTESRLSGNVCRGWRWLGFGAAGMYLNKDEMNIMWFIQEWYVHRYLVNAVAISRAYGSEDIDVWPILCLQNSRNSWVKQMQHIFQVNLSEPSWF